LLTAIELREEFGSDDEDTNFEQSDMYGSLDNEPEVEGPPSTEYPDDETPLERVSMVWRTDPYRDHILAGVRTDLADS
jgi:hypothetical protein